MTTWTAGQQLDGVLTHEWSKSGGVQVIQDLLIRGRMAIADPFVSGHGQIASVKQLMQQLRVYQSNRRVGADPAMQKVRIKYSGKDSSGQKDDLALSVTQLAYRACRAQDRAL